MVDLKSLRLSAALLFIGEVVTFISYPLHPQEPLGPNNHSSAFTSYAASSIYTGDHVIGFAGAAILIAGLIVLFFALNLSERAPHWVGLFGVISAGVAMALDAVLQAVDGVALKQAADAWVSAPAAEKTARFASAEAIRWLEWGVRSYYSFTIGLALVLFALVIVWTARVPRPIGYLMGLSGLAYLMAGWILGTEGFSASGAVPAIANELLIPVWIIWLLIVAWRMRQAAGAGTPAITPAS